MKPIKFPEANLELGKPIDWKDEDCKSLPAYGGYDHNNRPFVNSMWQPTLDDIKAVLAGRPVMMSISTPHNHVPPASVFTYNEKGEYNDKATDPEELKKLMDVFNTIGEMEAQNNRACNTLSELSEDTEAFAAFNTALANNKKLIEFIRTYFPA